MLSSRERHSRPSDLVDVTQRASGTSLRVVLNAPSTNQCHRGPSQRPERSGYGNVEISQTEIPTFPQPQLKLDINIQDTKSAKTTRRKHATSNSRVCWHRAMRGGSEGSGRSRKHHRNFRCFRLRPIPSLPTPASGRRASRSKDVVLHAQLRILAPQRLHLGALVAGQAVGGALGLPPPIRAGFRRHAEVRRNLVTGRSEVWTRRMASALNAGVYRLRRVSRYRAAGTPA